MARYSKTLTPAVQAAFLAAPIMASLRVMMAYLWRKINLEDPFPGDTMPFRWEDDPFVLPSQTAQQSAPVLASAPTLTRIPAQKKPPGQTGGNSGGTSQRRSRKK